MVNVHLNLQFPQPLLFRVIPQESFAPFYPPDLARSLHGTRSEANGFPHKLASHLHPSPPCNPHLIVMGIFFKIVFQHAKTCIQCVQNI